MTTTQTPGSGPAPSPADDERAPAAGAPQPGAGRPAAPAAKAPVGRGAVTWWGVLAALLVAAIGVVGVHDALVARDMIAGDQLLATAIGSTAFVTPTVWAVPVGIVLLGLGLWLLVIALRPRPRTGVALDARTGVFLRHKDVATLARRAAEEVSGVESARASAGRHGITVAVRATSLDGIGPAVLEAVDQQLAALAEPPRVRVTVTEARP